MFARLMKCVCTARGKGGSFFRYYTGGGTRTKQLVRKTVVVSNGETAVFERFMSCACVALGKGKAGLFYYRVVIVFFIVHEKVQGYH